MKRNKWKKWMKRNIGSVVMLLSYLLMGLGCGIITAQTMDGSGGGLVQLIWLMLAGVYGSLLIHIVLHEAGHMVFGLMTGYRFISFRIFSFVWQRTAEGRLTFGVSPLPGAAGQCLMSPPDMEDGKIPFVLYNLGGALMNLIISLLCVIGWAAVNQPIADALFLMCALVGVVTAVTNGVPMHVGAVDNDGYNILSMKKSDQALKGFWLQMKAAGQNVLGVRLRDMPEEWFFMPDRATIKNSMCASAGVFACSRMMDQMKFEEALQTMNTLLRTGSGMVPLHRACVQMDAACCQLLLGKGKEEADKTIDPTCRKLMKAMKSHLSAIRTEYVLALLGDRDEKKAEEILVRFEKAEEKWPSKADVESERELIACAQEKAAEAEKAKETEEKESEEK